ncbi:MAG: phosphatidate cytidylyltransferase [Flavobacteriales bacterium]|nr:phosphatidate cytidylyltransferase [Flavobacteriales bacterium]
MSNLIVRSIAGIIFSVAVTGSALLGPLPLGLLFLAFAAIGLFEFYRMYSGQEHNQPRWILGMGTGVLIYLLFFLHANEVIDANWFWVIGMILPVMYCFELMHLQKSALANLSVTVFGWIYVIVPFALINEIPVLTGKFEWQLPLGMFLLLWVNDTGAYFSGKYLGKHKLFPSVSPNKTIEGLVGGILLSLVLSFILSQYFTVLTLRDWLSTSIIVAVFGNLGDLFESHLKRTFGVKDSGNIIPGHGGVLDRFDGLFLTAPFLFFYLKLMLAL